VINAPTASNEWLRERVDKAFADPQT